jgi:signal transduction histidine kinase
MANRRITWPDLGLAAVLVVVGLAGTGPAAANQNQTAPTVSYLLVVAAGLSAVAWRWRPLWTFTIAGTATMLYIGLGYPYGPIMLTLAVAALCLALRSSLRRTVIGMSALLFAGVAAVGMGILDGDRVWTEFVSVAAWLVVPSAIGAVVKVRRDAAADIRTEQARRAISEERLQLAQEMHDVVGHGLAVIAMQSGVALRVLDREPDQARAALEAIRATSREALDGLRAELTALRQAPGLRDAPRRPSSGLTDLPDLAERMRISGLPVKLSIDPLAAGLPPEIDHAVYRIVQESLTNVLRHGGPGATADVRIAANADELSIDVLDTGTAATTVDNRGLGIDGMRERAEALGGWLQAGPHRSGGFLVRARLPGSADGLHRLDDRSPRGGLG